MRAFEQLYGIDLGTSNTLIYRHGSGIVLQEPSVVAIHRDTGEVKAFGQEAEAMIGRTPAHLEVTYPLTDGVIANYDVTSAMLKHFIAKIQGKRQFFRSSRVVISVPCGITNVQRKAVENTMTQKGANKTTVIEEPLAAAWGAGLPVDEPVGNMILNIGGGTVQVAVISMGGIVVSHSIRRGGMSIDRDIVEYIKKKYNLAIGIRTAEQLKKSAATALRPVEEMHVDIRGRDLVTGLPNNISVSSMEIYELLDDFFTAITDSIRYTLEQCPPELAGDLMERGITLCGGGAQLHGLAQRLQTDTGVPVHMPEQPAECIVMGVGKILNSV